MQELFKLLIQQQKIDKSKHKYWLTFLKKSNGSFDPDSAVVFYCFYYGTALKNYINMSDQKITYDDVSTIKKEILTIDSTFESESESDSVPDVESDSESVIDNPVTLSLTSIINSKNCFDLSTILKNISCQDKYLIHIMTCTTDPLSDSDNSIIFVDNYLNFVKHIIEKSSYYDIYQINGGKSDGSFNINNNNYADRCYVSYTIYNIDKDKELQIIKKFVNKLVKRGPGIKSLNSYNEYIKYVN